MSVLANISRVLILPKISCLAKKFSRLIIITSIFVIYANFDKNEGYHFHVALILPEFPRQCLLKFQFSFQGNISCTWITRFMVKFCFRYEIYGYEIYGRRCEIYGSLRDLWEGLRDLWEFARFMGVTRFMGRTGARLGEILRSQHGPRYLWCTLEMVKLVPLPRSKSETWCFGFFVILHPLSELSV